MRSRLTYFTIVFDETIETAWVHWEPVIEDDTDTDTGADDTGSDASGASEDES